MQILETYVATAPSTTITNNQINILPLVYDPRYHTFDSWASVMCEAYGANQLEIPGPTTEWKGWAVGLLGIGLFNNMATPDPYSFDDWSEWASALVNVFNPRAS
jgi:hypothetical protein